ncbi:unnamed protein product [Rhizoctonia solani]|uniref:Uncharacterized protein n=1 Tax=Rhizoctonia solani TaxID=456999 RepID=A0A8H3C9E2_9AGAM|nr:unnamed protein product [Rhizoctonia solani]
MLLARAALASGIIFPLYIAPGDNCAGWATAISAVTMHPNLPFYFIINPGSGPGAANSQPDTNYQACIPKLRPTINPNTKVLGYVPTWFADTTRSSEVQEDVRTYARWDSAYRPTGIFFDQTPTNSSTQSLYSGYTSYAKSQISNAFVTLNPGTKATAAFYNFADQIVSVENYYSEFSPSLYTTGSSTPAAKQAVILTDSSSTLPSSTINQIIKTDKIGALYITDDVQANNQNPYDSFPSYWTGFVDALYEIKWVGLPDDPKHNGWEYETVFNGNEDTEDFVETFWRSKPEPTAESEVDKEGCYLPGSMFVASDNYIEQRKRIRAAAGLPDVHSRPQRSQTTSNPITQAKKRRRSLSSESSPVTGRANRRREATPPTGEGYDPITPIISAPRPMIRPNIGSVLTFKKGKVVVQDRHRRVLEARQFRARGGLFLQQHLRKEREQRLAAAKKRAEEAQAAAEEEARRIAEELAQVQELARAAEEARILEENARLQEENRAKAARAAEWSAQRTEPLKPPSPPSLKALLGSSVEDDDLPDFEDDGEPAGVEADTTPLVNIFGAPNSLLSNQGDMKISTKKKADPFYWANKLAEERKQTELRSRHPILKLEVNETPIEVFMKDITNEPSRPPNAPQVSVFTGSIIDTSSTQEHVDEAITGIEQGWLPSGSITRLAPVDKAHWAILEVLALQMFVDGKVIVSSENNQGWRPVVFASEEEGIFSLLSSSNQLANYKATLLMTMVKTSS